MSTTSPSIIVGAAAAFFAFLSVIVGLFQWRWEALDSELERERKVNRLVPKISLKKSYKEEDPLPDDLDGEIGSLTNSMGAITPLEHQARNPDYTFSLGDITVRSDDGLQKLWRGLEGKTKVTVDVEARVFFRNNRGFPPDIGILEEFEPEAANVHIETPENSRLLFHVQSVDEDVVLAVVEELFQFIDDNLAQEELPYGWNREDV